MVDAIVGTFIVTRRPPAHIREKLDYGFRLIGQSVELLEIRPRFQKPAEKAAHAFAKATYVKARDIWKVYWMRGNLKRYPYQPSEVKNLADFIKLVEEDKDHCFFG